MLMMMHDPLIVCEVPDWTCTGIADTAPSSPALAQSLAICIEGMRLSTVIGIDKDEAHDSQPLILDLQAGMWSMQPCYSDAISDTLNYAALRDRVHRLMREHRVRLLEALAGQLADIALLEFGARWVRIKLCKPTKFEDTDSVGVVLLRMSKGVPDRR